MSGTELFLCAVGLCALLALPIGAYKAYQDGRQADRCEVAGGVVVSGAERRYCVRRSALIEIAA